MTSVYIAGSSRELPRCAAAVAYARSLDPVVTCDWPTIMAANIAAGRTDADLTSHERQRHAVLDLRGIADCRVFVLLLSEHKSEACVELGFALCARKPVVISTQGCTRSRLFDVLGSHAHDTDESALAHAKMLATPSPIEAGVRRG